MQMYKRERIYKSGQDNLEIVQDSRCKIVFYILRVNYWKLLKMALFIPPNNFWRVRKLHDFGKICWGLLEMLLHVANVWANKAHSWFMQIKWRATKNTVASFTSTRGHMDEAFHILYIHEFNRTKTKLQDTCLHHI